MKILVLNWQGAAPTVMFGNEHLESLRRLMDMGCYGELKGDASAWNIMVKQENQTLTLIEFLQQADMGCMSFDNFASLRMKLATGDWDYCQLTVSFQAGSGSSDPSLDFDRELGEVLQHLDDDTLIVVVGEGYFVLVSANNPISGEYKDGSTLDVAPTLIELAGYPLPTVLAGKSWVTGMELRSSSGLTEEEEAMLRERLSGLGYI